MAPNTPPSWIVVGCGKSKRPLPTPIADLYTSAYVTNAVRWARSVTTPDHLLILSAKHGLVPGTTVVGPYMATFSTNAGFARNVPTKVHQNTMVDMFMPPEPPASEELIGQQITDLGIPPGPLVLIAGAHYRAIIHRASGGTIHPYNPFCGIGPDDRIGYQMNLMIRHLGRMPVAPQPTSAAGIAVTPPAP